MSQVITNAFEQYWQSSLAAEQPVVLDEFILADIPNLDITAPIDPDTVLPPESQIVHRQSVDQRGRINNNAVAYTIVMDTTVGDFSFNAMYLRNKQNGVIGMIVYKGRETKLKTDQTTGQTGNSLVKSMLMGYDQAAEATLTNVDAGTWQIDYAARLRGMDEDIRQLQADLYGHHTFVGDGFKVVETDGAFQVTPGVAIVGGLRVELKQPEVIYPGPKPIGVWVDVHRAGSLLSEHQNHFTIITSVADLTDHVDNNGYQHFVAKLGTVQADNTVVDSRGQGGSSSEGAIPDTFALWKRSMAEAGYDLIGRFGIKATIQNAKQVMLSKDGTLVYAWRGALPKDVPADGTMESTGGIGPSMWLDVGFDTLRIQLAAPGGSKQMGFEQAGSGSVGRTVEDKLHEGVTPLDKGAAGDGVTLDDVAFAALEAMAGRVQVDMLGKTYLVTTVPSIKEYFNGTFITAGDSVVVLPNRYFEGVTRGKNTIVGVGAGTKLPQNPATSTGTANTVMGEEALKNGVGTRSSTAIGTRAMYSAIDGKYNVAIGLESLYYVDSDGSQYGGTRNTAVGANSGRFITQGYQNVMMGRNAAQCLVLGYHNTALGNDAMAGRGSLKFKDSQYIQNQTPFNLNDSVAVGYSALYYGGGNSCAAVGSQALGNAKSDAIACNALGADTLKALGTNTGIHGKVQVTDTRAGTYVMTPADVTFTLAAHGFSVGWYVIVSLTSGVSHPDGQYYQITEVIDANTFKVFEPLGIETVGTFSMVSYETATTQVSCAKNTAIGTGSMYGVLYGFENVAIGTNSNALNTNGSGNAAFGDLTMRNLVNSSFNSAFGYQALQTMTDGSQAVSLTNSTGLGRGARVSGNDQAQIGNSAVTVYVHGTVQNRSDERDKAELEPTTLGDEFIDGLVAEQGRWDMRDDYFEEYTVQVGIDLKTAEPIFETRVRQLPKDGSKKRNRKHQWFVAQKVKVLCDAIGKDFGGFQDHSVNGGCDVLSLGYDEFIPPLTAYVQRRKAEIRTLEGTVSSQQTVMEILSEQVAAMNQRLAAAGL